MASRISRRWIGASWVIGVGLGVAMALAACGPATTSGPGPEEPETYAEPEPGGEPAFEEGGEASEEAEPFGEPAEAPRGGGGQLRVKIMASGEAGTGSVRVISSDKQVAAEGPSSRTFEVPTGTYDLEVTFDGALDRPEKRVSGVRVGPGETTVAEVTFTIGQVTLQPRMGKRSVGKQIRWRYSGGGDWFEQASEAGQEVVLSAGRYDAEVEVNKRAITITDIQVYEGRRTISPEVHMR